MLLLLACATPEVSVETADATTDPTKDTVDTSPPVDTDDTTDTAPEDSAPVDTAPHTETADTAPDTTVETDCYDILAPDGDIAAPDYAQFLPVLNSTCTGTNHQDITSVQQVVFLGDSITVGSPPTTVENMYRNVLAAELVSRYGLAEPEYLWGWYDAWNGTGYTQDSGDFSVCAKWGARTDDLIEDNDQVTDCIPESRAGESTLVVMTVGGNDLFSLVEDYYAGVPVDEMWVETEREMGLLRDAVTWMKTDKERFPGEMNVVFANVYEFTDMLGNVDACEGAATLGYTYDLSEPDIQEMIAYMQEEALSIAVDTDSDMMFLGEAFCGHGYNADDPTSPCYRGADAELWFDLTCFHPNDTGHLAIADLFLDVITE